MKMTNIQLTVVLHGPKCKAAVIHFKCAGNYMRGEDLFAEPHATHGRPWSEIYLGALQAALRAYPVPLQRRPRRLLLLTWAPWQRAPSASWAAWQSRRRARLCATIWRCGRSQREGSLLYCLIYLGSCTLFASTSVQQQRSAARAEMAE